MTGQDLERRVRRLEAIVENRLQNDSEEESEWRDGISRRSLLQGLGLLGLGGYVGKARADPQGQIGTSGDPLRAVYTQVIHGGVTENTTIANLLGPGLSVENESLRTDVRNATSLGTGTDLFTGLADGDLQFRSIVGGSNVSVSSTSSEISLDATGTYPQIDDDGTETVTSGQVVDFGTNLSVTDSGGGIATINSTAETNTASNVGTSTGAGLFKQKSGSDLEFKSLVGGSNLSITKNTDTLTLDAAATYPSVLDSGSSIVSSASSVNFASDLSVTDDGNGAITVDSTAVDTASNLGGGTGVFSTRNGTDLEFNSLIGGSNVSLSSDSGEITIDATDTGEVNTASNIGTGSGIFAQKDGTDLEFKRLVAGSNLSIDTSAETLTLNASDTIPSVSDDGTSVLSSPGDLNFAGNLSVSDDGDGTVSINAVDSYPRVDDGGTVAVSSGEILDFGTNLSVTDSGSGEATIDSTAEANTASNVGTGSDVFKQKTGSDLEFKTLVGGSNLSITAGNDALTFDAEDTTPSASDDGSAVVAEPTDFNFGTNLTVGDDGDDTVTIDSTAETNTASNVGTGGAVFKQKVGQDLEFRTLVGGSNLSITQGSDALTLDASPTYASTSDDGAQVLAATSDVNYGTNLSVTDDGDGTVSINSTAEANTASNLGGGTGVFAGKSGTDLEFKSLVAGTNVSLSNTSSEITLDVSETYPRVDDNGTTTVSSGEILDFGTNLTVTDSGSGEATIDSTAEANTASNVGTGSDVFKQKVDADLEFKSLVGGSNVTVSSGTDELTIDAAATYSSASDNGTEILSSPSDLNFGSDLSVTDDGDGTVTVESTAGYPSASDSGTQVLSTPSDLNFAGNLSVSDDGDGTVSISAAGTYPQVDDSGTTTVSSGQIFDFGTNLSVTDSGGGEATIDSTAEANTASNLGGGTGVFSGKNGSDLEFNSLVGGSNVTLSSASGEITVDATATYPSASDGGTQVLASPSDFNFGTDLSVTDDGNGTVTVNSTAGYPSASDNGTEVLPGPSDLNFGNNLSVIDDNDGTVSIDSTAEANTASNVGTGSGVFKQKTSSDLEFKSLSGGTNVSVTAGTDELTIDAAGTYPQVDDSGTTTVSSGQIFDFGSNLSVTDSGGGEATIDSTAEANTASNLGAGTGVFSGKNGSDLEFNSLNGGTNVSLSSASGEITIDADPTYPSASDDGTETVASTSDFNFGSNLTVSDSGSGTATIDAESTATWSEQDSDDLLEPNSPFVGIDLSGLSGAQVVTPWVGTTTATAFEGYVNSTRVARFATTGTDGNSNTTAGNVLLGQYAQVADGATGVAVGGGGTSSQDNVVYDNYGVVGGGQNNQAGASDGDPTTDTHATVSGGDSNVASGPFATVGGGESNTASGARSTIGGGTTNSTSDAQATVGGGGNNEASGYRTTVGGGYLNQAQAPYATIAGGGPSEPSSNPSTTNNVVYDDHGTVGGGGNNQAGSDDGDLYSATYATVAGGGDNTASGQFSAIPGGQNNTASGSHSFAMGNNATANDAGAFVIADSSSTEITSNGTNEVRSQIPMYAPDFNNTSARSKKTNIERVSGQTILEQVRDIDVYEWEFKQTGDRRHIGPMAGEFKDAIGLGDGETISTIDADGVALGAIKGLDERFEELTDRLAEREALIADLVEDDLENETTIEALRATLQDRDDRIDALQDDIRHRDERVDTLEADIQEKDDRIEALTEQLEAKDERIDELETRLEAIERAVFEHE